MVSIKIDLKKRDFVWVGLVIVLVSAGVVMATWDSAKSMFHNSEDVKITIEGVDYSLQEALDDGLIGGGGMKFGDYQNTAIGQVGGSSAALVKGTDYQAATDGFVIAQARAYGSSTSGILQVLVEGSVVGKGSNNGGSHDRSTVTVPVGKDDSWRVNMGGDYPNDYTIYWVPIVSGSSGSGSLTPGSTGSATLSNGLIMKWGEANVPAYTDKEVVFDTAFPNAVFQAVVSWGGDSGMHWTLMIHDITKSSFYIENNDGSDSNPTSWIAMGY